MNNTKKIVYHDNIIIGAGAAGLQAGYFLKEKERDYLILEKSDVVGSHWRKFPRHRRLISINKPYVGSDHPDFKLRHDWNSLLTNEEDPLLFTSMTDELYPHADVLFEYFQRFQERHKLNILHGVTVKFITKTVDDLYEVRTEGGDYFHCRNLFLAMGALPHTPDIPNIDLPGIETYESAPLEKKEYRNQRVLIIGKGNSGLETANHMSGEAAVVHLASPSRIKFAWNTHFVGDVRAFHNNILDMYQLKSQHGILNGNIADIQLRETEDGKRKYAVSFDFSFTPDDPYHTIEYDRIIRCTGYKYVDLSLFDLEKIPLKLYEEDHLKKFPKISSLFELEGAPNLFGIGPIMQSLQYRKNATGFIHGFRYNIRTLIEILCCRDDHIPLPFEEFNLDSETLGAQIQYRLNTTSALYQQYADLCDVVVLPKEGEDKVKYYYELPLNFVKNHFQGENYFVVYLDYGSRGGINAFDWIIQATPSCPEKSTFLHPILLAIDADGKDVEKQHIIESLETIWDHPIHHGLPIRQFIERRFVPC